MTSGTASPIPPHSRLMPRLPGQSSSGDRVPCGGCPTNPRAGGNSQAGNAFLIFFFFWAGNSPFFHQERLQVCSEHPHTNTLWGSLQKASRDFWDLQEPARLAADGGGLGAPPELQLELLSPSWLCQGQGQPLAEPSPSRLRRCQGEHKESPKEIWDPCPQILNPQSSEPNWGPHTWGPGRAGTAVTSGGDTAELCPASIVPFPPSLQLPLPQIPARRIPAAPAPSPGGQKGLRVSPGPGAGGDRGQ